MVGTAVGLLLSAQIGLFRFKDSLATSYVGLSLVVEVAGARLLAAGTILIAATRASPASPERVAGGQASADAIP
jgi:hypothetical protein